MDGLASQGHVPSAVQSPDPRSSLSLGPVCLSAKVPGLLSPARSSGDLTSLGGGWTGTSPGGQLSSAGVPGTDALELSVPGLAAGVQVPGSQIPIPSLTLTGRDI